MWTVSADSESHALCSQLYIHTFSAALQLLDISIICAEMCSHRSELSEVLTPPPPPPNGSEPQMHLIWYRNTLKAATSVSLHVGFTQQHTTISYSLSLSHTHAHTHTHTHTHTWRNKSFNSPNSWWLWPFNLQVVIFLLSLEVCKDDRDGVSRFGHKDPSTVGLVTIVAGVTGTGHHPTAAPHSAPTCVLSCQSNQSDK